MSSLRRVHRHFLPHFFAVGHHHSAHGILIAALFLYLQILVVATAGVYVLRVHAPRILGTAAFSASSIIQITNEKRAEYGLGALAVNDQLSAAAAKKAEDMIANDYWAHNSPSGRTPWTFVTASGYRYIFAGENLARDFSDASSVVRAWMNSPTHRANLLDRNFAEIGVAVASGKLDGREGTLVVQMFGSRGDVGVLAQKSNTVTEAVENETNVETQISEPVVVLASQKSAISKVIAFGILGFIFTLLSIEAVVTVKRSDMQVKSSIFAHLALLGFVLLAVWYAVSGAII